VLLAVNFQLVSGVFVVALRLTGRISQIQFSDIATTVLRLVLIVIALHVLDATVAIAIATLGFACNSRLYRRWAGQVVDLSATSSRESDQKQIWHVVRHQAPLSIYYCLQGQTTIFLLTIFGGASNIADVGALARLAVVFTTFSAILQNLVVPKFAKTQAPEQVARLYWLIVGGSALVMAIAFTFVYVFRDQVLWLLGAKFQHLSHELVISFAGTAAAAVVEVMGSLNRAKAWVRHSWIFIPLSLGWMICLLQYLNIGQTHDAVIFGALAFVPALGVNLIRCLTSLYRSPATRENIP
jgi:O-antigen/teichoic acid export membrane protein